MPLYLLLLRSLFSQMASCYYLVFFYFTCRIPLSVCSRTGLVVTHSHSFCLSGNVLISPSLWRIILSDIGFLVDRFLFPFSTMNVSFHCFLASKVFDEKSADNFIGDPLFMKIHFYLASFKILLLSLPSESLTTMWVGVGFFELILRIHWAFGTFIFMFFIKFGKFTARIYSNIPTAPFSLLLLGLPQCIYFSVW